MSSLTMTISKDMFGDLIITSNFGSRMRYVWYSKREAVKMYRQQFHAERRHIETYDYTI